MKARDARVSIRCLVSLALVTLAGWIAVSVRSREYDRVISGPYRLYNATGWTVVAGPGGIPIDPEVVEIGVFGRFIVGRVEAPQYGEPHWRVGPGYFVIDAQMGHVLGRELDRDAAAALVGLPSAELRLWSSRMWAVLP